MGSRTKRKQRSQTEPGDNSHQKKRLSKTKREQLVCKDKLQSLEQSESLSTEDRFSQTEKNRLLEIYNQHGFQAFQDTQLLQKFFPHRTQSNLKGLVGRLSTGLQQESSDGSNDCDHLNEWQKLCMNLMGNFARDKRVNLDDALADALMMAAEERESYERQEPKLSCYTAEPNYPELLRSFAQLLSGKFPDNMTPANARISMRLFDHINELVESMDLSKIQSQIEQGTWLEASTMRRREQQEMAHHGLNELNESLKSGPTLKDFETSKNIEALCLELPKIKRIRELLNPLHINESLVNDLIGT